MKLNQTRRCTKCLIIKPLAEFNNDKANPQGKQHWCRICANKKRKEWEDKNPERCRANWAQPKHRFRRMRYNAMRRKVDFRLSLEQYLDLSKNKCTYCGDAPPEFGGGLDRIDSSIGYQYNNVVVCCYKCNVMKSDLTVSEFYEHIAKILAHKGRA